MIFRNAQKNPYEVRIGPESIPRPSMRTETYQRLCEHLGDFLTMQRKCDEMVDGDGHESVYLLAVSPSYA